MRLVVSRQDWFWNKIRFFRYLQEFTALGTAGGMYHFRDQIRAGNPTAFFVLNGDVCADFPLQQLHDFHVSKNKAEVSWMVTILNS